MRPDISTILWPQLISLWGMRGKRRCRAALLSRLACLLLALSLAGCDNGVLVPVSGRVVFSDGQPLRSGKIEFRSPPLKARGAAVLDDQGRFTLTNGEGKPGLPPGDYEVVIVQVVMVEHLSLEAHDHGRPLPRRYADYHTSGLRVSVPPQGTDQLTITVEPDP